MTATSSDPSDSPIHRVHRALFPTHGPTPVHALPDLAAELGCRAVYLKDESSRFGLPAFKILGASWAIASLLGERWGVEPWDVEALRVRAREEPGLTMYTATDGNHGRAVAHVSRLLGVGAHIFVPGVVEEWSRQAIASEGCNLTIVDGDYDAAVRAAADAAAAQGKDGIVVQDMSWEGYEDIPARIVAGYTTIAAELDAQLPQDATAVVVPVGVGSLAHSIVQWYAPRGSRTSRGLPSARIITAEPTAAPCLHSALASSSGTETPAPITAHTHTIMAGLNCGTVTASAWPDLRRAVELKDAAVVSDAEALRAVEDLDTWGVQAGPCGAATVAAVRKVTFGEGDVVVLICTEGRQVVGKEVQEE